jgi:hypothetical protein
MKMPKVTTTAQDLVPSTESETPDSPMMGGAEDTYGSTKKIGKESLKITRKDSTVDTSSIYY